MIRLRAEYNTLIDHHIHILKLVILCICLAINPESTLCQKIMHNDPYDIKKTNVSGFFFVRPTGEANAGPQLRISHYITPRFMLIYNGYFGIVTTNPQNGYVESEWGSRKQNQKFLLNALEMDIHLIDQSKNKDVDIFIPVNHLDTAPQGNAYTKFNSPVRRILCFTTGMESMQNREDLTSKKDEEAETNQLPMIDLNTGRDTIINYASIFTNSSYVNLLLGLKFKFISAVKIKFNEESSLNDRHIETYLSLIIPMSHKYDKNLYNKFSQIPTHQLHDYYPKPGFKFGIYNRNSIRNNWSFGAEFGVAPTIITNYWKGAFIHLSLGMSLNFGKIKYIDP